MRRKRVVRRGVLNDSKKLITNCHDMSVLRLKWKWSKFFIQISKIVLILNFIRKYDESCSYETKIKYFFQKKSGHFFIKRNRFIIITKTRRNPINYLPRLWMSKRMRYHSDFTTTINIFLFILEKPQETHCNVFLVEEKKGSLSELIIDFKLIFL